jgi:hypothetical protein
LNTFLNAVVYNYGWNAKYLKKHGPKFWIFIKNITQTHCLKN